MTIRAFLLFFSLFLAAPGLSFANTPVALVLDHTVEITTPEGTHRFCVHFANDRRSRIIGLMFREEMAEKTGMLFDFEEEAPVQMWMRNTVLSLDMIFIHADGRVHRVERDTTPFSTRIIHSGADVRYVLEVNAGETKALGIGSGASAKILKEAC